MIKKYKLIGLATVAAFFLLLSCKNNLLTKTEKEKLGDIPVKSIRILPNENELSLVKNTTKNITVQIIPEKATNKTLIYSSKHGNIASIDNTGLITAKKEGSTDITIEASNGVKKKIYVTVTPEAVSVTGISLIPNEDTISLVNGTDRKIEAHVIPQNATDKTLTFSSSAEGIASVNAEGLITAHKIGEAVITIQAAGNVSKAVKVNVTATPVAVTDIVFDPALPANPIPLSIGGTYPLHAKAQPKNATDKKLTYTSDNAEIASVNADGLITAKTVGSVNITIKASNGVSKEITVTVTTEHIPVTGIALTSGETAISVENRASHQIYAYVVPANATNPRLLYDSNDSEVAYVSDDGLISTYSVGSATITITAADNPALSKQVTLTVTPATVHVASIEFNPPLPTEPIELFLGEIYKFDAKAMPEEAENRKLNFKTSDHRIAWLEDIDKGWVKADGEGEAIVTVTADDNPLVKREVRFKMTRKPAVPSISIETPVVEYESDEANITIAVKTLNGKLAYTPEVVGGGTDEKAWLTFVSKVNTDTNTDTVHLSLKKNKTVWDRTAYIKFKDNNANEYIKVAGKPLQVELTQKKNEHPIVTIKWVDGINEPTPSEKKAIQVPHVGQAKKFYWKDENIFFWYESKDTKWFNNRKSKLLSIPTPDGGDGNQCWAKTASNMLHWWFVKNKKNIDQYIAKNNITGARKDEYQDFYKREFLDNQENEKSYIAKTFRTKAHNGQLGDYIISGLGWYLYGNSSASLPTTPEYEGPALFKDVFNKEKTPIEVKRVYNRASFNDAITGAIESKKAIGITLEGSKGQNAYAHAITLWGAVFDEEENIIAIYVVDNNFTFNRIFPYGIYYKDGRPYLFNYPNNAFVSNKYVGEVTTLDKGEELWQEWFRTHP